MGKRQRGGRRGWASVALVAALMGTTGTVGCGWIAEEIVEQMVIADKARAYEFPADLEATWTETRAALAASGYTLEGDLRVDESVECEGPQDHFSRSTAYVRIVKTGWFSHRLEIDVVREEKQDGVWRTRAASQAADIEWTVISRRDPTYAREVEAKAKAKGEKGRNIVRQIDDLLSED